MSIEIKSDEFWIKIVGFLEQNWALIEGNVFNNNVIVFFIQDASLMFDKIEFDTLEEAQKALIKNGFKRYLDDYENFTDLVAPPKKPFLDSPRPIYSSGEYWEN